MELNICHLYPDILNLYGDRGNVLCMRKRLNWRGIEANVEEVSIGQKLDLRGEKTQELISAIEDGLPVLAICGGYQMLGQYYKTWDGVQCDFTGALNLYTVGSKQRMIGNYMYTCDELGTTVVGFENHSGKSYLGDGVKPIGKVMAGFGNNGEDGFEGARYKNVFATYSHGCLLPKNPQVADFMLKTALERKYGAMELKPLDNSLETAAHDYMQKRLSEK